MIKATELRIGNIVWNDVQKKYVSVDIKVIQDQLWVESGHTKHSWKPVKLNEEILLKAGFEEEDYIYDGCKMFGKNGFYILVDGDKFRYSIYGCLLDRNSDVKYFDVVEHLHTLQNIFYYTKFEELKIQL